MSRELERAIVTTGGTKEPIDHVRFITNFATGRFGYEIAEVLAQRGYSVKVFCPAEVQRALEKDNSNIIHENFTSAASLREALLRQQAPATIFQAAAVSDYTPKEPVEGKIPSTADELTITLVKTPKILDELRGRFGKESFIVGFKLLSGVTRQELIEAAMAQNKRAHLNLTVANDLQNLHDGQHPVTLVTAESGALDIFGSRQEVAGNIVEFVKKRSDVTWYHTEKDDSLPPIPQDEMDKFSTALRFAQRTKLLYDSSGNVSMRLGDNIVVTPRQVDKSKTLPEEACIANVDHENNVVRYQGEVKSSIDTAVNDALYRALPKIKYMLHFHTPWGKSSDVTSFPYPCGVKEEAQEILEILGDDRNREEFSIELLHHGFLIGLPEGGLEKLEKQWEENVSEFKRHLQDVNQGARIGAGELKPNFAGTENVGVLAQYKKGAVVYLSEKARGRGVGRKVAEQLAERQTPIITIEDCNVMDFYRKFGFTEQQDTESALYTFYPPKISRTDKLFDKLQEWKIQ